MCRLVRVRAMRVMTGEDVQVGKGEVDEGERVRGEDVQVGKGEVMRVRVRVMQG